MGQEKLQREAKNYAVKNIPRFDEELEATDDDDDLFGKIVDEDPADPAPPRCHPVARSGIQMR